MVQTGGVKLRKLHVRHRHSSPVGHGHAVASGNIRIGRVQVNLTAPPRRQNHMRGAKGLHFT